MMPLYQTAKALRLSSTVMEKLEDVVAKEDGFTSGENRLNPVLEFF